jgi:hypothetical protein
MGFKRKSMATIARNGASFKLDRRVGLACRRWRPNPPKTVEQVGSGPAGFSYSMALRKLCTGLGRGAAEVFFYDSEPIPLDHANAS